MHSTYLTVTLLALSLVACDEGTNLPPLQDGAVADSSAAAEALARCDIRTAHAHYDAVWRANGNDPAAALGFAVTDMLLIGEDPEAVEALRLWGFTSGIDSEELLWGPSALLDSFVRHTPSREYGDFVRATFPFPPVRSEASALDLIDPSTTAQEVVEHAWAMQDRFKRLSSAFELAARNAPQSIEIGGICGVGEVELQAPELYLLAAGWQGVVLGLQVSRGYDWDFVLLDAIDFRDRSFARRQHQAAVLNEHLGAVADAGALSDVREAWRRFFDLTNTALEAADSAVAPGTRSLVEWRAYRAGLLPAMLEQGRAARSLADGRVSAPGLSPQFEGELSRLYEGDLDLSDFGRTFSAHEDPMWGDAWIEVDEAPVDALLMSVLSRSPFDETLSNVEWTHIDAWRGGRAEWQITEVPSARPGSREISVPRFVSPAVDRYRDHWHFE